MLYVFLKFTTDITSYDSYYVTSGYTRLFSRLQRTRLQVSAACKTQLRDCLTLYIVVSLREFPHMQQAWVIHDNINHWGKSQLQSRTLQEKPFCVACRELLKLISYLN